jgi:hypothetical protein
VKPAAAAKPNLLAAKPRVILAVILAAVRRCATGFVLAGPLVVAASLLAANRPAAKLLPLLPAVAKLLLLLPVAAKLLLVIPAANLAAVLRCATGFVPASLLVVAAAKLAAAKRAAALLNPPAAATSLPAALNRPGRLAHTTANRPLSLGYA